MNNPFKAVIDQIVFSQTRHLPDWDSAWFFIDDIVYVCGSHIAGLIREKSHEYNL